jgi:hypothetical protein
MPEPIQSQAKDYNPEDTVNFVNITDRDFVCRYDGRKYLIRGGESMPFRLPVAQHFAKHLADAMLQEEYDKHSLKIGDKLKTNRARLWIDPKRPKLYAQMIPALAEELEAMIFGAEALSAKLDERDGLQAASEKPRKPGLAPKTPSTKEEDDGKDAELKPKQ